MKNKGKEHFLEHQAHIYIADTKVHISILFFREIVEKWLLVLSVLELGISL